MIDQRRQGMEKTSKFLAELDDADTGLQKLKLIRELGAQKAKAKELRRKEEAKM